jgi:hypothetical protein
MFAMCCPRFFSAKKFFSAALGQIARHFSAFSTKNFICFLNPFPSLLFPFHLPNRHPILLFWLWLTANRLDDWQVGCWWMEGLADLLPHHHISCFLHPPSALPLPLFSSLAANPPSPISNPFSAQSISNPLKNISLHPLSNPFLSFASFQLSILIVQMILL